MSKGHQFSNWLLSKNYKKMERWDLSEKKDSMMNIDTVFADVLPEKCEWIKDEKHQYQGQIKDWHLTIKVEIKFYILVKIKINIMYRSKWRLISKLYVFKIANHNLPNIPEWHSF